jgi:hypothetical protein
MVNEKGQLEKERVRNDKMVQDSLDRIEAERTFKRMVRLSKICYFVVLYTNGPGLVSYVLGKAPIGLIFPDIAFDFTASSIPFKSVSGPVTNAIAIFITEQSNKYIVTFSGVAQKLFQKLGLNVISRFSFATLAYKSTSGIFKVLVFKSGDSIRWGARMIRLLITSSKDGINIEEINGPSENLVPKDSFQRLYSLDSIKNSKS